MSLFFSTPSHVVQRPCMACATALECLVACSCRRTSSTIIGRCSVVDAFCQRGVTFPRPKPPLPCWTWPTTLQWRRANLACSTALAGVHFLPVARAGGAPLSTVSRDLAVTRLRHCRVQSRRTTSSHRSSIASPSDEHGVKRPHTWSMAMYNNPYWRHQSFSFPGSAMSLICLRPFAVSCRSCSIC